MDIKDILFEEVLSFFSVKDIRYLAKSIGLKIPSGLKKDALCSYVSMAVISNPQFLLDSLFIYELKIIKDIIENPQKRILLDPTMNFLPISINEMGDIKKGERDRTVISKDLAATIQPLIDKEIAERMASGQKEFEDFIIGKSNLHGLMEFDEIRKWIDNKFGKDQLNGERVKLHNKTQFLSKRLYAEDLNMIYSPYHGLNGWKFYLPSQWEDIGPEKKFSEKEIADAALMPFPQFNNEYKKPIKKFLKSKGFSEDEIEVILIEFWKYKQEDKTSITPLVDFLPVDSIDELNEWMGLVIQYTNNLPFWKFGGYSSKEIADMERAKNPKGPLTIKFGPGVRKQMAENPDFDFDAMLRQISRITGEDVGNIVNGGFYDEGEGPVMPEMPDFSNKIGRNDPCPCGSGKKYKHCHGKN